MLGDSEEEPAQRFDPCINCGQMWGVHIRWECRLDIGQAPRLKSLIPAKDRFTTADMLEPFDTLRLVPAAKSFQEKHEVSDWRAWSHKRAGECACGIIKAMCDYHK